MINVTESSLTKGDKTDFLILMERCFPLLSGKDQGEVFENLFIVILVC